MEKFSCTIKNMSLASTSIYSPLIQNPLSLPTDVHDVAKTAETFKAVERVPVYTRVCPDLKCENYVRRDLVNVTLHRIGIQYSRPLFFCEIKFVL